MADSYEIVGPASKRNLDSFQFPISLFAISLFKGRSPERDMGDKRVKSPARNSALCFFPRYYYILCSLFFFFSPMLVLLAASMLAALLPRYFFISAFLRLGYVTPKARWFLALPCDFQPAHSMTFDCLSLDVPAFSLIWYAACLCLAFPLTCAIYCF